MEQGGGFTSDGGLSIYTYVKAKKNTGRVSNDEPHKNEHFIIAFAQFSRTISTKGSNQKKLFLFL